MKINGQLIMILLLVAIIGLIFYFHDKVKIIYIPKKENIKKNKKKENKNSDDEADDEADDNENSNYDEFSLSQLSSNDSNDS